MDRSFRAYNLNNLHTVAQMKRLPEEERRAIEVVGRVFPIRTNSYMVEELIDWDRPAEDPMYRLNFPCREMLSPAHFRRIEVLVREGAAPSVVREEVRRIRLELHPYSVRLHEEALPAIDGRRQQGIVHSYPETVLFFPTEGQMCHAHCTFCFRWHQFVGDDEEIFTSSDIRSLVEYVSRHEEVRDILFTGGDPLFMKADVLCNYVDQVLRARIPHLNAIRFGTKSLTYWPYRFLTDPDADRILSLFERIAESGLHVAVVANINHPREISTDAARGAIARIRSAGAEIRAQSPLLRNINAEPGTWSRLWQEEVRLGVVPYYQFVVRDTGARDYFGVPLVEAVEIFREAYADTSGICRTVRGPCMSTPHGKVQVLDLQELDGRKALVLRYLQTPVKRHVMRTFFAAYDDKAQWFTELKPFGPRDADYFPAG